MINRNCSFAEKFCIVLLLILSLLGVTVPAAWAQSNNEPPLTIVGVEASEFPTLKLTIDGADWPAERAVAPLQVFIDGTEQTIQDDRVTQQPIQFMVAVDPNDLSTTGQAGQSRYVELTGALLDLIENNILVRNQDWLAAYLLLPDEVQSIQDWTQEPNLVFNSIVQKRPAELTGAPLSATTLINALQQFTANPPTATTAQASSQPRSLMLISAGADTLEVAPVVAVAQELAVQIHAVEFTRSATPTGKASPLAQLAQQTGGHYIALDTPAALAPLWERIAADHTRRVLTFQASVPAPQSLEVRLQLPGGSTLNASVEAAALAGMAAATGTGVVTGATAPVTAAPAVQNVLTRAEPQAPVANALPVTAGVQNPASDQAATAPATAKSTVALQLPTAESISPETQNAPGAILIPGLQLALPRGLLQISLPILMVLIGYFVYAEVRDRRKKRKARNGQAEKRYKAADPLYALDDNSHPIAASPYQLNERDTKAERGFGVDGPPPAKSAPQSALPSSARPPVRQSAFLQEDDEAEATMRPPRMEDDEATYRVQDVEQPVIGFLVRATSDPNLPKELPVYGLNPAAGEVRQIHIGRHSKHNTVVINDKSISREHAVIVQRSGRLYLRDNGSTSGTFLNWKRLNPGEELLLRHNDLISFGQIVYEFRLHGEDEVTFAEG